MKLMMNEYERALEVFFRLRFKRLKECNCNNGRGPKFKITEVAGNLLKVQTKCMTCGNVENMVITCTLDSFENASSYDDIIKLLGSTQVKSTPVVTNFSLRQRNLSKKVERVNSDSARNYEIIQGFNKAFG